jgi:hypothetical protein
MFHTDAGGMPAGEENERGALDRMRLESGFENTRVYLRGLAGTNLANAQALLADGSLRFGTLYLLLPDLQSLRLLGALGPRSAAALVLCREIVAAPGGRGGKSLPGGETAHAALRWMLLTGGEDTGLSNEYDQILDTAAAVLIRSYHDGEALPAAVAMVFSRRKKGLYLHDLVWALFSAQDASVFPLIAGHLRSPDGGEAALAAKLLRHAPEGAGEQSGAYEDYMAWLGENGPYLLFTGEAFQSSSDPVPCRVDLPSKYLCRGPAVPAMRSDGAAAREQRERAENFRRLGERQQAALASYSARLHGASPEEWKRFMGYPLETQLRLADADAGGAR